MKVELGVVVILGTFAVITLMWFIATVLDARARRREMIKQVNDTIALPTVEIKPPNTNFDGDVLNAMLRDRELYAMSGDKISQEIRANRLRRAKYLENVRREDYHDITDTNTNVNLYRSLCDNDTDNNTSDSTSSDSSSND